MKKEYFYKSLIILFLVFNTSIAFSQVGIGTTSPEQSTALDVESSTGGVLIPRMTTNEINKIHEPATGLLIYNITRQCLSQNVGTKDNPDWMCLRTESASRFFYLPSINISTEKKVNGETLNLYEEYKAQFSTPLVSSNPGASIPYFKKEELEYFVTAYDKSVLNIHSISSDGVMKYDVIGSPTACSFINVVLVEK